MSLQRPRAALADSAAPRNRWGPRRIEGAPTPPAESGTQASASVPFSCLPQIGIGVGVGREETSK
jgi:hypothetical protein